MQRLWCLLTMSIWADTSGQTPVLNNPKITVKLEQRRTGEPWSMCYMCSPSGRSLVLLLSTLPHTSKHRSISQRNLAFFLWSLPAFREFRKMKKKCRVWDHHTVFWSFQQYTESINHFFCPVILCFFEIDGVKKANILSKDQSVSQQQTFSLFMHTNKVQEKQTSHVKTQI